MIIEVTEDETIALFNLIYCTVPTTSEMWDRLKLLYFAMAEEQLPRVEHASRNIADIKDIPRAKTERRIVSKAFG